MTRSQRIEEAAMALSSEVFRTSDSCEWLCDLNEELRAALSAPPEDAKRCCRSLEDAATGEVYDCELSAAHPGPCRFTRQPVRNAPAPTGRGRYLCPECARSLDDHAPVCPLAPLRDKPTGSDDAKEEP